MPARTFRQQVARSYFAPFVALAILTIIVLWQVSQQVTINRWIQHSQQVLLLAKDAELRLRDAQLDFREYLVSHDQRTLRELSAAEDSLERVLEQISGLVNDNPDQEQLLLRVSDLKGRWVRTIESEITSSAKPAHSDAVETQQQQAAWVFQGLERFSAREQQLLNERISAEQGQYRLVIILVPLLALVLAGLLELWGWNRIRIASEQFAEALRTADRESRTKNDFLSTVSHELRNPLNSVLLWSSTLKSRPGLDEQLQRGLNAIDRAARAQAQMIEDLLDMARIESGRFRLDVQTVDLGAVVKAAVESLRPAADAKSIAIQELIDPRVAAIAGDPGRLQQVVWNLMSNAIKFTPKSGKIEVRLERINSHVELTVADNGAGIEASALPFVFERFWQGTPSARQGVGLGLSIVKEIVALHGGTVVAHSEGRDKGSTFTVRLSLPVSTASTSAEIRRHPTVETGTPLASNVSRLDGICILVVDDDPDACAALQNLLGGLGAKVAVSTSADAALITLEREPPDAIVSDIGMPVQDGYYLVREVRQSEQGRGARTPMIALTAYGRVEDKVKILAAGFDAHLIKPVDPAELAATLRSVVSAHSVATA